MTFKKLFAGITSIAMVFSVVAPVNFASANAAEDLAAYNRGYDEGLTTMTSFDAFNFENAITREQAAKFLVAGAEALGLEDNIGGQDDTCDYADLGSADTSLISYIAEGCELGLFKAQTNFRPLEVFTRGQAELVVARMLNGYDAVNDYADDNGLGEFEAAHEMLMNDDVVHVNVDLNSAVRRGHLMLMLYRLQDAEPTDPDAPVNPGHAEVSRVASAGTQNVPYNANKVKVGTVKISAGSNGARVSSVVVKRSGLGNYSDIDQVWLENPNIVSRTRTLSSDETAAVRFAPVLDLAAGSSQTFDVMVALKDNASSNSSHEFSIIDMNVSNGTTSGTPISLGTLKTTSYKVQNVTAGFDMEASLESGKVNKRVGEVTLTPHADATVNGFVLDQVAPGVGTPAASQKLNEILDNVTVYYNRNKVGKANVTRDSLVVSDLGVEATNGEAITLELRADVVYVGDAAYYAMDLKNDLSSINVKEKASGYGMKLANSVS